MTPEDRALIVRRLRQEAARIEDGGEPRECVARGEPSVDLHTECLDVAEARDIAGLMLDRVRDGAAEDGYWHDVVDGVRWGVVVTIEEARVVTRQCATSTTADHDADEEVDYGLVDAGVPHTTPEIDPCEDGDCQRCHPWCETCSTDLVDGVCPTCGDER